MTLDIVNKLKLFIKREYTIHQIFQNWTIYFLQNGVIILFTQTYGRHTIEQEVISLIPFLKELAKIKLNGTDTVSYTVNYTGFEEGEVLVSECGGLYRHWIKNCKNYWS